MATLTGNNPHDRDLIDQVHPPDWKNPVPSQPYHLVVIGAGTAGLVTAAAAAGLGARVALIERNLMGGDCLNTGCVPSKGLISAARIAAQVRDAGEFGVQVPKGVAVDFAFAMDRMRSKRAQISPADSAKRFQSLGVDVYFGQAKFVDQQTISVTAENQSDQNIQFRKAVLATGARAAAPPIPGLDNVDYLTNENLFSLQELPRRFGIVGSGPIGCEMAQSFARFGSQV
ncbi:MAG: FAD-dependent oxidoreductase, partial [Planctomycetaceae bacterium]|nr:FAD-dependent oxidoreductase [Planctomycetaceae bacterium]